MQQDIDAIADRLERLRRRLVPKQIAGGALTALEARSIVGELDRSITEARATGRRVSELLTLIVTLGGDGPPPAARAPLRVIGESETGAPRWTTRGRANRYRFTRRDDDGPEAA